ncbi:MAG: DUF4150 domain-containing protein [Rhodospirillales bacterium]
MANEVFANGNEVACKAGDGKVIAAFPDVCLSPPSPPAGPIPVPYPNTSFSRDMQNGSRTVKISGKEVMLRDKSFYKTAPLGDEAATNGLGAGVVTHVITGKTYFTMWSMDVKIEGENVDRHIDLTTSNHASLLANVQLPRPNMDTAELSAYAEALAEQDVCPCCNEPTHSDGPIISEAEFYGTQDIIFQDPAGVIQVLDAHPNAENLLNRVRNSGCADLLPEPPCNVYRVASAEENDDLTERWRLARPEYQARMRMHPGQQTGHRVPRSAGGCPIGVGNLTPVRPECQEIERDLGVHQGDRIRKLRPLWGRGP